MLADDSDNPVPGHGRIPDPLGVTLPAADGPVRVRVWPAREGDVPAGPVLVCFHGWTDSAEVFAPLAGALDGRWTLVAADAPGHGGTPWHGGDRYRTAEHLGGALALLDALPRVAGRPTSVVLLGHAMGALTAARATAARPELVRHLVLEDPARTAGGRRSDPAPVREWVERLCGLSHEEALDLAGREHPGWSPVERQAWADAKRRLDPATLRVTVDWGEPLVALLADVPCPVTLVRGRRRHGGTVAPAAARRCAAACRSGCEVVTLESAGHSPRREAPAAFLETLDGVLRRHARVAARPSTPVR